MSGVERNPFPVEPASSALGHAVSDVCAPFAAPSIVGVEPHLCEGCSLRASSSANPSLISEAAPAARAVEPIFGDLPEAAYIAALHCVAQPCTGSSGWPSAFSRSQLLRRCCGDLSSPLPFAAPTMSVVEHVTLHAFPGDGPTQTFFQPALDGATTFPLKSCLSFSSSNKVRRTVSFAHQVDFWFPAFGQLKLTQLNRGLPEVPDNESAERFPVPAIVELPKAKAKVRQSFRLGHTPYVPPPAAPQASGLHAPLSAAGHTLAPAISHPLLDADIPCPFSSFDEIQGTRVLAGSAEWRRQDFVREALVTSNLPGNPTARLLVHEIASYPSPQVAISQDRGSVFMRAVVTDALLLGGDIESVDVRPGATVIGLVRSLRTVPNPRAIEDYINLGSILCFINREVVDAHRAISPDADVAHFVFAAAPGTAAAVGCCPAASCPDAQSPTPDTPTPPAAAAPARFCGPRPRTPPVPVRPAAPPVPPASVSTTVVRRFAALASTGEPFTTFDAIHGHRTFQSAPHSSFTDKLRLAIRASPGLGDSVRHSWLTREVEGLPSPQFVLQRREVPDGFWTFPLDLRQCGGHVCVLVADREASAIEFLARATDTCRLSSHIASSLDAGYFALEVDGAAVSPSSNHILRRASVTRLRRTALWSRHLAFQRHGATAVVLPERYSPDAPATPDAGSSSDGPGSAPFHDHGFDDFDHDRFFADELTTLLHVVGLQPTAVSLSTGISAEDVVSLAGQAVQDQLPEVGQGRCRWMPCPASPVGEHLFHSVLVPGEPEAQMEAHVVLDLRAARTTGPEFHSAVFPAMLSTELLFRLLANFLGGFRPAYIFQGTQRVEGYLCSLAHGTILRPVFQSDFDANLAGPALWRTSECLAALPCMVQTLAQSQCGTSPVGLPMPSLPCLSSTDTASALEVASVEVPLPAWEVATTTTTSACPVYQGALCTTSTTSTTCPDTGHSQEAHSLACSSPLRGVHQRVIFFHAMGTDAAVAHTTVASRCHTADILSVLLWCMQSNHALAPHCQLTANTRIYFDDACRPHVFMQFRAPRAARHLWIFAPCWHPQPFGIPWDPQLELSTVLDAVGLTTAQVAIVSVDGEISRGHPARAALQASATSRARAHVRLPGRASRTHGPAPAANARQAAHQRGWKLLLAGRHLLRQEKLAARRLLGTSEPHTTLALGQCVGKESAARRRNQSRGIRSLAASVRPTANKAQETCW